eukprot:4234082-Prymnesium_polylepis.1
MPIVSAVAEVATDSTLVAHLCHSLTLPSCAAWSLCSSQLRKLRTRQDGRTVSRVGLHYSQFRAVPKQDFGGLPSFVKVFRAASAALLSFVKPRWRRRRRRRCDEQEAID